jgi:hypothetical protein
MGGFIVGFDSDTHSTFQRQIDFIKKSGIVTAMVGLLREQGYLIDSKGKIGWLVRFPEITSTERPISSLKWGGIGFYMDIDRL